MRKLKFELRQICYRNPEGPETSQKGRKNMLESIADTLEELGFRHMGARSLQEKHVIALVKHWKKNGLANETIKNRMSKLRWWAKKVGLGHLIKPNNAAYGIE